MILPSVGPAAPHPGTNNTVELPLYADAVGHDFRPLPALNSALATQESAFAFQLSACINRSYVIEFSTNTVAWWYLQPSFQTNDPALMVDAPATNTPMRLYRARQAP